MRTAAVNVIYFLALALVMIWEGPINGTLVENEFEWEF